MLPVADPRPASCKICGTSSPLCGLVDFHKSCMEGRGKRLPLSGVPIYYRRCPNCRFLFTDAFDAWSGADFLAGIYNAEYIHVDPDYLELRPASNAKLVADAFAASRSTLRILDYGGGNGVFAGRLRQHGFTAESYDQFSEHNSLPAGRSELVTCFEVAEHAPFPRTFAASLDALLKPDGMIVFSTLLQPSNIDALGLSWWYAAPRNGHVSLFSPDALRRLFAPHGLRVTSLNDNLHLAYRSVPAFAAHFGLPA